MKKISIVVVGLLVVGIAVYAYLSPSIAFHNIQSTIEANDVDTFSTEIEADEILSHLRNRMSLHMQDALRSYPTLPDPAKAEVRLAPYFGARGTALAVPASIFRELGSQLKERSGNLKVEFKSSSVARVNWTAAGDPHEVLLSRHGLSWKLSAVDFPEAMPKFWDQPTVLHGTYYQSHFMNCCFEGNEKETQYNQLQLKGAMDIVDVFRDSGEDVTSNVTQVQIGANSNLLAGIKDGDLIDVHCKSLWQGNTGHYALPVYCDASEISRAQQGVPADQSKAALLPIR